MAFGDAILFFTLSGRLVLINQSGKKRKRCLHCWASERQRPVLLWKQETDWILHA